MYITLPTCLFSSIRSKAAFAVLSMLLAGTALNTWGQGELPSGTISGSGSGPYTYNLSFADGAGATSPVGSVWYAWTPSVPPFFYLPGTPSNLTAPTGWTANVNGNSIQFVASSSAFDIQPGGSLSGFGYTATFSPTTLAGMANSGLSMAYAGGIESAPDFGGVMFTVTAVVPEPGTLSLLGIGAGALAVAVRRRSR
jgi:hypothetical protein